MTKTVTHHASDDRTTSRGTVKGEHPRPEDAVPEGGPAPSPTEGRGAAKASATSAGNDGAVAGDDTSTATAGRAEKQHAAGVGDNKTQSGRGHRKHDARAGD
jgi:hypothetical protein